MLTREDLHFPDPIAMHIGGRSAQAARAPQRKKVDAPANLVVVPSHTRAELYGGGHLAARFA